MYYLSHALAYSSSHSLLSIHSLIQYNTLQKNFIIHTKWLKMKMRLLGHSNTAIKRTSRHSLDSFAALNKYTSTWIVRCFKLALFFFFFLLHFLLSFFSPFLFFFPPPPPFFFPFPFFPPFFLLPFLLLFSFPFFFILFFTQGVTLVPACVL